MIAAIFLAVTLAAQADSPTDSANGTPEKVSVYAGDFHRPPVLHWRVPLPGGKVNAASHAERSRPAFNDKHVFTDNPQSWNSIEYYWSNKGILNPFIYLLLHHKFFCFKFP